MSNSKRPAPTRPTISEQLRATIRASGHTYYAISKLAGVNPAMLQRFMLGERTLRLDTVDKIAAVLGLDLIERKT